MFIKDLFEVGEIMEWEDKNKAIKPLDGDDCVITGKQLNKSKIILHMKRVSDDSEGNVFVRLKDDQKSQFAISKKFLASKKVLGLTLNQFKNLDIEEL
ncbi:MAG: hypothetical protein KGJ93_05655 [Patescibacteria group bacterium]|nr:hypothetical protein [Patescibacteria group bacterium]